MVAGAPELADLAAGNRFEIEGVDGVARQVLVFPKGSGLSLPTQGLVDPRSHSVAMLFRLAETEGYRRILDFSGGTSDDGLYNLNGNAVLYGLGAASRGAVFSESYAQVTLTNSVASSGKPKTSVYVNGTLVAGSKMGEGFNLESGVLRFFKDNVSGPAMGEESAGAVACILVYDGALTAAEVSQIAADRALCGAPRSTGERAKASVTGRPAARKLGRRLVVDTGLTVSCPIGSRPCRGSAKVDVIPGRGMSAKLERLGAIELSVPAGQSGSVFVPLSRAGARALREAGRLRIRASVKIAEVGEPGAAARQQGVVQAPRSPSFRAGLYSGVTSQNLPVFVSVSRTAIRSIAFRWRARCSDGRLHTNTVSLRGERVRRGRFSFGGVLDSGGSAHVSGRIEGTRIFGTLSRTGTTVAGVRCSTRGVRWRARLTGVEADASR